MLVVLYIYNIIFEFVYICPCFLSEPSKETIRYFNLYCHIDSTSTFIIIVLFRFLSKENMCYSTQKKNREQIVPPYTNMHSKKKKNLRQRRNKPSSSTIIKQIFKQQKERKEVFAHKIIFIFISHKTILNISKPP